MFLSVDIVHSWIFSSGTSRGPAVDVSRGPTIEIS
jgi:hypothetical protein